MHEDAWRALLPGGSYITSGRYISYVSIKPIKIQIGFNIFIKIVQHLEIMDSTFSRSTMQQSLKKILHSTFLISYLNISA